MGSILLVTTPAADQDLTSLANVKTELGITGTSEDAKLAIWITQASRAIATHCSRVFGAETVSEQFRLDSAVDKLILGRFPVISVTTVTEDEDDPLVVTTDYETDPVSGLLTRLSDDTPITWSASKIVVAYQAGYELLDGLPEDVQRACVSMVKNFRSQAKRDPMAKRIEIPDVRTVDYWVGKVGESGSMPPDVLDLLAPYVVMRLA